MSEPIEIPGRIAYARRPPRHRRWMAVSVGNGLALGNVSYLQALGYCVFELLRGNGPCYIERMAR